jgi:hypothetical protein
MFRCIRVGLAFTLVFAFSACGSAVNTTPITMRAIQSSNGATSFALGATSATIQLAITEAGYHGAFTASSSNVAVATVSPATLQSSDGARVAQAVIASNSSGDAVFTITAVANGNATITVADDNGNSSPFAIVVSGIAAPLPSASPSPTPSATPIASPAPSPTPSPGPLAAAPAALTFNGTAQVQTVTITDPGATTFTVSGCSGIAMLSAVTSGTFTVTSVGAGSCSILVSDAFTHQVTVAVGVTTLGVPIQ